MTVLSIGQLLDRRYRIVEVASSEAFGQTYLAADIRRPGYPQCLVRQFQFPHQNPKSLHVVQLLFKKKAETLEKLGGHDRIPKLLACFEQQGHLYFVEELIVGQSLATLLVPGKPWPEDRVRTLVRDVLETLAFVHQNGVIHRNLCPDTLIRRQADNHWVLANFELVQDLAPPNGRSPARPVPDPAAIAYSAPEQLQGTPRYASDLYSLGAIAIQALTGLTAKDLVRPQQTNGSRPKTARWRERAAVGPGFGDFADRLADPDPDRRYGSAEDALDALDALERPLGLADPSGSGPSGSNPAIAPPPSQLEVPADADRLQRLRRRRAAIAAIALLAAAAVAVGLSGNLRTRYWLARGSDRFATGDLKGAIAAYDRALALGGREVQTLYRRSVARTDAGDYQGAIADLNRALRRNPDFAPGYFERGNARYYLGDTQGALEDYDRALAADPDLASAYLHRGNLRADLGDDAAAIADYDRAIELAEPDSPVQPAAYLNRGLSRSNLGDQSGAIADATQAIQLKPDYALAYQNRGLAHRRAGDLQAAIEDFNVAAQLAPDDPDPYYNRGIARYELGEIQGTIEDFNQAIALQPEHALVYYDRGVARLRLGDRAGAIADFQESAKLCLDRGRLGCYRDAQYQLARLQAGNGGEPGGALPPLLEGNAPTDSDDAAIADENGNPTAEQD